MVKSTATAIQTRVFWIASIVFFISGGTGLIYQVAWFKRFSHVWGSSSLAFAAVAGSFLFGLGLGAYLFGRTADRVMVPLRWYGACELLIGALALLIPFEIAALVDASAGLYNGMPQQPLLRYLVQFCITLLVVGPPCVLMGGTLPLLIRQLTMRDGSLDQATGWLYAINTFGAATGCYLAGFHLLPSIGLLWTNNIAAAINLAIGVVSLAASNSAERLSVGRATTRHAGEQVAPLAAWSPQMAGLYLAAALTGCGALVLEMTWTRQLALVIGGSTYAFTATLFVVLVGIGLGSLIFHVYLRGVASSPLLPIVVIGMIVAGTLGGVLLLPSLSEWTGPQAIRNLRSDQLGNGLVCVTASVLIELLPALGMGILFPLFVHMTHATAARVGSAVGNIYAWNTLGSIVGATLTSAVLFPWIGTAGAAALATAMYVVSLLAVLPWRTSLDWAKGAAVLAVGAAAAMLVARPIDPRLTNLGAYLYGPRDPEARASMTSLLFVEGASSSVLVTRNFPEHVSLRVNGKVDASNGGDMITQTGSAYLPRMFKTDAKEIFVIGFGSGCTPGRSMLFPGANVVCCELEPAVYAASEHFGHVNSRPHEFTREALVARNAQLPADQRLSDEEIDAQARFSIVFGDGRTAIQGSAKKYDLIISEPSNPWVAGCSNLFTREFFRAARAHLNEGGVLAQWIQSYHFTADDYLMIVRTMRAEFPYYGVIELAWGADTLLVASDQPLIPKADELLAMQKQIEEIPDVRTDFETWFGGTDPRWTLISRYLLGKDALDRLIDKDPAQAGMLNTDLHLRLEFDAPLHLFRKLAPEETVGSAFQSVPRDQWLATLAEHLRLPVNTPEFYAAYGDCLFRQAEGLVMTDPMHFPPQIFDRAAQAYQSALKLAPDHAAAQIGLSRARLRLDSKMDREQMLRKLIELKADDAIAHSQLASVLLVKKNYRESVEHYREALRRRPELLFNSRSYSWANNLAWILATCPDPEVRNGQEALAWALRAKDAARDNDPSVIDTLAAALAEVGRFDEAVEESKRVLEMAGGQERLVESVKERIKLYEAAKPYREG